MSTLRLALVQMNSIMGDFSANLEKIRGCLAAARRQQADLVVCPELSLCGYPPEDLLLRRGFLKANLRALRELSPGTRGLTVLAGLAEGRNREVYNSAALLHDGGWVGTYQKMELPNYGVFDEKRYFSPGTGLFQFTLQGWRVAVTICEDIWVLSGPVEQALVRAAPDLIVNLSASPFHAGKLGVRRQLLRRLALKTKAPIAYINLVGGQDELVFDGGSLVMGANGEIQAQAPRFVETVLTLDLSRKSVGTFRRTGIRLPKLSFAPPPLPLPAPAPAMGRLEEVYAALCLGTRDYVQKNGFQKVVIGLSGGIDSALTAAIATDALGKENVIGITMPSQYTSRGTLNDAERVASRLGIQLAVVPIRELHRAFAGLLSGPLGGPSRHPSLPGLANENLQARIRGNILMAFSNHFGYLVLTTGNKSETAVGYCTLYGDMAGGFAVIKDVPKTMVVELARWVNAQAGHARIPESVIRRPPTAELRPNQKDEDSLPPYRILDGIIRAYVEKDLEPEGLKKNGFPKATVDAVVRMVDGSEYKRRQAPPGIKITPKAFGRDRRLPITNHFRQCKKS